MTRVYNVIDADGRNDHRVTRDSPRPIGFGALAWSPDGRSIAYDTNRTGSGDIYLIDADGHHKARLTNSADIDVAPSWVDVAPHWSGPVSARSDLQPDPSQTRVGTVSSSRSEVPATSLCSLPCAATPAALR